MLEIAVNLQTNRLAIHATELVIWPVIVRMLRVVAAIVIAVIVAIEIMIVVVIETCHVTLVTRAVTFHVTVQMAPSHATTVATRGISVVNVPKMVAEIKK